MTDHPSPKGESAMPPDNLREEVARIIDPTAFEPTTGHVPIQLQKDALAKADAILALQAPSLSREGWRELVDYLHDQALLAESEAALRVGGQRNRLLAEAADCFVWAAALSAIPSPGGEGSSRPWPIDGAPTSRVAE